MRFSIIVPVYNTESYIRECIESVLVQTYNDYELILVDDGSTDNSGRICESFSTNSERITYIRKENSGQYETRSVGVSYSSGEYLIFLDSDDVLAPFALSVIDKKITHYNCDMLVYEKTRFEESPVFFTESIADKDITLSNVSSICLKLLSSDSYNSMCIKAVRRDLLLKTYGNSLFELRCGEDLIQTMDVLINNPVTTFISDVLYYYRVNKNSVTHTADLQRKVFDAISVRNYVYEFVEKHSILNVEDKSSYSIVAVDMFIDLAKNVLNNYCDISTKEYLIGCMKANQYYNLFLKKIDYNAGKNFCRKIFWALLNRNYDKHIIRFYNLKIRLKVFLKKCLIGFMGE